MKSFYQFYESMVGVYTGVYIVYRRIKGIGYDNVLIKKAYVDKAQAIAASHTIKNGEVSYNTDILGPLPHNIDKVYVILIVDKHGKTTIYSDVYVDKHKADVIRKSLASGYGWHVIIEDVTFVANTSTPKSPYANFKYPLIGELTHYFSTPGLNQEIYHTMRDKSQKSINLINYLKTLIKKIELV